MTKHFTQTVFTIGLLVAMFPALAQSQAQSVCGPRDQLITKLEGSYGEMRMGAGLRGQASMFEIWASVDSGTWTILMTNTDGISCVMASGESWQSVPATAVKQGAPA